MVKQRELRTEVQELTKRKKFCESAVSDLTVSAYQLAQTAEKSRNFTKMLESNAVRKEKGKCKMEYKYLMKKSDPRKANCNCSHNFFIQILL